MRKKHQDSSRAEQASLTWGGRVEREREESTVHAAAMNPFNTCPRCSCQKGESVTLVRRSGFLLVLSVVRLLLLLLRAK